MLWQLLGEKVAGVQMVDGAYAGKRRELSIADLEAHFAGEVSIAIRVATNDRARVMGFDVDERAPHRLPLLASAAAAEGFTGAMVATGGSDEQRGKLIIFFATPQPAIAMNRLAWRIRDVARRNPAWGIETAHVELRPLRGEGGLLRIGGRNIKRGGSIERFFDPLTGEVAYLSRVRPSDRALELEPEKILVSKRQPFVEKWIAEGLAWPADGTAGINRRLTRLAHEAYRLYGADGKRFFAEWVAQIEASSLSLRSPSPKNKDPRPPLAWSTRAKSVWIRVLRLRSAGKLGDTLHSPAPALAGNVMYGAEWLREVHLYVERRGLNPQAFALSYRELARAWGVTSMTAWRRVQSLVVGGKLAILDRGTQGERGLKTIFALPVEGIDRAYRLGAEHHMVLGRQEKRAAHEARKAERDRQERARREPVALDRRRASRAGDASVVGAPAGVKTPEASTGRGEETRMPEPEGAGVRAAVQVRPESSWEELLAYARGRGLVRDRDAPDSS